MIRVGQVKISIDRLDQTKETERAELIKAVAKTLRLPETKVKDIKIIKKSVDARKKEDIKYIYAVDVVVDQEDKILKKVKSPNVMKSKVNLYEYTPEGMQSLAHRPIVVGTGPAGLFCAYMLAEYGYQPLVLERGADVDKRIQDVEQFWLTNQLDSNSNVQFGEGGAGTFSDGKLNTVVRDDYGRNRKIYETFVEHGGPSEILYNNKPHIGTDRLRDVVKSMRERIISLGGEVRFHSQVTDMIYEEDTIKEVVVNGTEHIPCEVVVLAIGHSARDTFELLYQQGYNMTKKNFAIGVRIEHSQDIINHAQYGDACIKLPTADYKVTYQSQKKRSIYSFCMCPGGFVVNSSSEQGHLVVNGMSNYKRDERNANSAMIVGVTPEDFFDESPLAGMYFQRHWEKLAYEEAGGKVPVQLFGDFSRKEKSTTLGAVIPNIKGEYELANVRSCLPEFVSETIVEGIRYFDQKIPGFGNEEAILSGVETRTSSPVRIVRDEFLESNKRGVYPCGEGAGYAGGITSAAMDGIKVFEAIARKYKA